MKTCTLIVLSGVVLFGSPALAGEPPAMPGPPTFAEFDANGDLLITEEEFRGFMEQRFAEREDGRRGPPAMPDPPTFAELDANGDLLITEEEIHSFMEQRFAEREDGRRGPPGGCFNPIERADTDGDGALNEQEYQQMMERMRERGKRPPP